jgi:hypothetical protein
MGYGPPAGDKYVEDKIRGLKNGGSTYVMNWIEELKVETCVTQESVRRMYFGMNPEPEMIFYVVT